MQPKLYPRLALALLTVLNVLNFIDRNVLLAVQPLVKQEFQVTDAALGLLTSAFFFTYMFSAPVVGWMGDRFSRKALIVTGVTVWSGFTLLTGLVHDYHQLLIRHAIVGIGEASYAAVAPSWVCDLFPLERRGRALAIFNCGLAVGSAGGLILGASFGHPFGWRAPFLLAGIPGFVLALVLWRLPEPPRGRFDPVSASALRSTLPGLMVNPAFWTATIGLALYTFAVGGLQVWIPTFLNRVRGVPVERAGVVFGIIVAFNGIVAVLIGGWLGDRMLKRHDGAYYAVAGLAMFAAVPFMVLAVYASGPWMFPLIFVAVFFLLVGTAPSNGAVVNAVNARIRSTALALNLFVIHLLGDAFSPWLIGAISDRTSLLTAFSVTFAAAAFSGMVMVYGARFAPRLISHRLNEAKS
ncbi:MAG: MFS transporter [Verrucomicrobia bacterium]|nr:MFS transporter [Verrucomicrobiota bacterium]